MKLNFSKSKSSLVLRGKYDRDDLISSSNTFLVLNKKVNLDSLKKDFYDGKVPEFIIENPASDSGTDIRIPMIEVGTHGCTFELNKFDWVDNKSIGVDHYRIVLNSSCEAMLTYTHDE